MIAAAYLRRSSISGDRPGDASRELQEAAVRRLCGPDVVLYVDWGITGSGKRTRPEYERLKSDIVAGRVESVCAYSLSRLGRSTKELLSFVELCTANGVTVSTAVESISTAGAMGKLLLTIMAAVAEFESNIGSERSAAAREAEKVRHAAAGLPRPPKFAIYGKRVVKAGDGLRAVVDDPDRPIDPIIDAWREAGNFRATVELLGKRGIPSPFGKRGWSTAALARILTWYAENEPGRGIELPAPGGPKGRRRSVPAEPTLLQGLVLCHCGRRMTPNRHHRSLYCSRGHLDGKSQHGRFTIAEAALLDVLRPIAESYDPAIATMHKDAGQLDRERIERKMAVLDTKLDAGRIAGPEYKQSMAVLQGELARLGQGTRTVIRLGAERIPDWSETAAMNAHLRRLWTAVRLDQDMIPTVEWAVPDWAHGGPEPAPVTISPGEPAAEVIDRMAAGVRPRKPAPAPPDALPF